ncbi:MAG: TetR family transcriptional regulator C-terminal domain-containing protein [Gammaproteobacteria bacterium]|nr:TetR family transcriptional regulator C-terminal domain-containing protein [Gammaproteobacteria bacterium]
MRKGEVKKEQILWAGLELMKLHGYNGTSVKDIVDAAGVPKGSFYNYFDSKESFATDALEAVALEDEQMTRATMAAIDGSPLAQLQGYFTASAERFCDRDFRQGCFFGNMAQEMSDSNDVIRDAVERIMQRKTQSITQLLDAAQAAGEIRAGADTSQLAEFVFNAWEGTLMRMKASRTREPLQTFLQILPRLLT